MRRPRHHARIDARLATKAIVTGNVLDPGVYGRSAWAGVNSYDLRRHADLAANPVVAIGLNFIRQSVPKGRLCVGNLKSDGTFQEVTDNPIRRLFEAPNPYDRWEDTLGATAEALKVNGNAYWIVAADTLGESVEVYWYPNYQITIEAEDDPEVQRRNGPIRWYWLTVGGRRTAYPPARVIHFRDGIDPHCRWMGLSSLMRQISAAASIDFGSRYTLAVLRNAHSGKVLSPKETVGEIIDGTRESVEMGALARRVEDGISGENAGRVIETFLPVDVFDIGMGPEEMGLDRILDRPEAYLLAAMGLNALACNVPGSQNLAHYANKGEARREAWEFGVIPVQDLIAAGVQQLLRRYFPDPPAAYCWWDRRDVEALREDRTARASRAVALYGGPIATLNEARGEYDLKPVEGGDATPLDEAAAQAEAQQAAAEAAAAAAQADGTEGDPSGDIPNE